MHFDVVITKEGKQHSSWCPQLDIASCGSTVEEAKINLKEAIELYLEDENLDRLIIPLEFTFELGKAGVSR